MCIRERKDFGEFVKALKYDHTKTKGVNIRAYGRQESGVENQIDGLVDACGDPNALMPC